MPFTTSGQETEWALFLQPLSPHGADDAWTSNTCKVHDTTLDDEKYNIIECCNNTRQGAPPSGKQTCACALDFGDVSHVACWVSVLLTTVIKSRICSLQVTELKFGCNSTEQHWHIVSLVHCKSSVCSGLWIPPIDGFLVWILACLSGLQRQQQWQVIRCVLQHYYKGSL